MPGELLAEKPQEKVGGGDGESESKTKEAPAAKQMVGIIYPPPEVRNIVDKTADFVARNGPEFEGRIRLNEAGNTKFNFLNPHDPYHAYYRHKIVEIQEGVAQEAAAAASQQQAGLKAPPKPPPVAMTIEPEVPKEPPPEWEFMADPPTISAIELGIVKLTAQFVARNGAQFLDKLMMREQRNYQFDFLRKQHPLFTYFTKLVEQYSKVLIPPRTTQLSLNRDIENPLGILDGVQKRVEWEQYQARQKRKAEEEEEKQRMEYAQIDWHDFVIVETISFRESEAGYLPPPIRPTQLAQRLLQQQKYERMADEGGEVQEIEMEVEEPEGGGGGGGGEEGGDKQQQKGGEESAKEKEEHPPSIPPPPPPPSSAPPTTAASIQIRRDYNPKVAQVPPPSQQTAPSQYLISPITGEKIPVDKIHEHMRYGLLDPRWIEEQKRQTEEKKNQEVNFATGVHIGSHLKNLAERRTDIFGVEETVIGKRIGEEMGGPGGAKKPPSVQWDGHSASAEIVQRQAQSKVTAEDIEAIQKAQGLLPDKEKERIGPILPTPSQLPLPTPPTSQPPPAPPPSSRPGLLPPMSNPPHSGQLPMQPNPAPLFATPAPLPPPPGAHGMPPPPRQMAPPGMQPPRPPIPQPRHPGMMPPPPPSLPNSAPPLGPMPHMPNQPRLPHLLQPSNPQPIGIPLLPVDLAPPVAKRPRAEMEDLLPEQLFIANNPGPVTFKVLVPTIPDRPEWKLNGQIIAITLPITDPVSVIKAKLSDELGMPSGKQKLQIGSTFIKDSNSLGYYNISSDTVVLLGLKERGGRKK